MSLTIAYRLLFLALLMPCYMPSFCQQQNDPLTVKRCMDFEVNGKGDAAEWKKTSWVTLTQIDEGKKQETTFKIMYSAKGIYVLFQGEDERITSPFENDFDNLFNADVFEVFFHPDPSVPMYFEYEISPLNKELVLLISNLKGKFGTWTPWHYEGNKKTKKAVHTDGAMRNGEKSRSWSAEIFFPYALLNPFQKVPPQGGTVWNANFCRLDYDSGKMIKWSWSPIKTSFHEFEKYRSIRFE